MTRWIMFYILKNWDYIWNWEWNLLKFTEFFNLVNRHGSNHILTFIQQNEKKLRHSFCKTCSTVYKQRVQLVQLFINSVFGKTMECLRNRINLKLVTNPIRAKKLIARPTFQRFDIINKDWHQSLWWKTKYFSTDRYISVFLFWTFLKSPCTVFITRKS